MTIKSWDDAEAVLATNLPTYEPRVEQQRLAHTIEQAIASKTHLLAQAGTGTGKSFAALIPAIIHAVQNGQRVVVATGTKALQGQYALKDLPFLAANLDPENLGAALTFTEMKGRGNYVCEAKLAENPNVGTLDAIRAELAANPEHSGDLERFEVRIDRRDYPKISSTSEECPGKNSCPFGEQCYAVAMRERAAQSHILVVNHALLAIDLIVGPGVVLPEHDVVLVDEAHNFEDYLTNALGSEVSQRTFDFLVGQVDDFLDGEADAGRVISAARAVFAEVSRALVGRENTTRITEVHLAPVRRDIATLQQGVADLATKVKLVDVQGDDRAKGKQKRLQQRLLSLSNKLTLLSPWDEVDEDDAEATTDGEQTAPQESLIGEVVRWVRRDDDRITLGYSPLSVANFLRETLWANYTVVLLSATLAVGSDFSYIAGRLGVEDYQSFDAGTPFDYPNQAAIFVPNDVDPRKREEWTAAGDRITLSAIRAAGGRAMLLFTSTAEMKRRYSSLANSLADLGFPTYMQGEYSTSELIARKTAEPDSVIFGLKSMMEGVSIEGDALQLVILDRMPMPVPSEVVFQARCEAMDTECARITNKTVDKAKWDTRHGSFYGMAVPIMSLLLAQAFGRLIRTKTDRGLVIVMDMRMHPQAGVGYGKQTYRSLPQARPIDSMVDALGYLRGLQ